MLKIGKLAANASSRFLLTCILAGGLCSALSFGANEPQGVAQAVVAYGFLVSHYPNEFLVASEPVAPLGAEVKILRVALDSLHCDFPERLAFPHDAIIVPSTLAHRWLTFPMTRARPPVRGWLFLINAPGDASQRVLVVYSSGGPSRTTIFWLERARSGYATKLVYDSFKKPGNSKEIMIGRAGGIKLGPKDDIFVKELIEPGAGPPGVEFRVGRLFRIDLSSGKVALVGPGAEPSH